MRRRTLLQCAAGLPGALVAAASPDVRVRKMLVESVEAPVGLTVEWPAFSWQVEGPPGWRQSSYRLKVASVPADPALPPEPLWDSGDVKSADSLHVIYGGPVLRSRARYRWTVTVSGAHGRSAASPAAEWEMGLLRPGDWTARFIGIPRSVYSNDDHRPCPYLRRSFDLPGPVRRARLYCTSAGIHQIAVNGLAVGDRLFRPGYSDYRKRLYIDTHDVTRLLRPGRNTLGATLADGWFSGYIGFERRRELYGRQLALLAQLEIEMIDGARLTVSTDESWEGTDGPLRAADFYMGEVFDARRSLPGWAEGAPGPGWRSVQLVKAPQGVLVGAVYPPVRATEEVRPASVTERPNGDLRVDFGRLFAGLPRVELDGYRGQTVKFAFAEGLQPDGELYRENLWQARSTDTVVLEGRPLAWEPRFGYHGFRYVDITGLRQRSDLRRITASVVNSDVPWTGSFECSHSGLNRLSGMIRETLRSNLIEVMTGASQRDERVGWTGDAAAFLPTAAYLADLRGFMDKWLADIRDSQLPDGSFPTTAPSYAQLPKPFRTEGWPDLFGPIAGWSDAAIRLPWEVYRYYGDRRVLERHLPGMERWVSFLLRNWPGFIWRPGSHWLFSDFQQYGPETPRDLFSSAFLCNALDTTAKAARSLGRPDRAARYAALFARARERFAAEFIAADGAMPGDTQSGYVLALALGLVPAGRRAAVVARLTALLERDGHIRTGMHGTRYILSLLVNEGRTDLAERMALSERYPSFLRWIQLGLTMIPERWDAVLENGQYTPDAGNSLNQYALGCIGEWLYGDIGGLAPAAPGWKRIRVAPRSGGRIASARLKVNTPYGDAFCSWERHGEVLRANVTLPANTSGWAVVRGRPVELPAGDHIIEFPADPGPKAA